MLTKAEKDMNNKLYKNQSVFVIPSTEIETVGDEFIAFTPKNKLKFWSILDNKGKYIKRADAEGLSCFYQPIPYIVLINSNGDVLLHKFKHTEKTSIGFSEHILLDECGYREVLFKSCVNIITKQLNDFSIASSLEFKGYIKTFTKQTLGHLGFLFVLNVGDAEIKSDKSTEYEFMSIEKIKDNHYGSLEEWAKIAFNHLYELQHKEG